MNISITRTIIGCASVLGPAVATCGGGSTGSVPPTDPAAVDTKPASTECDPGADRTWRGVTTTKGLLRENQASGFSMRAGSPNLCESTVASDAWRLLSPEKA